MRTATLLAAMFLCLCSIGLAQDSKVDIEAIKKGAEPVVDNILESLKKKDFKAAVKDFSEEMAKAMDADKFKANFEGQIEPKIGTYLAKKCDSVSFKDDFVIVVYAAGFTKEEIVLVKVVFKKNDPAFKVQGLWWDSPKLRQK